MPFLKLTDGAGGVSAGVNGQTTAAKDTTGANLLVFACTWLASTSPTISDNMGNTLVPLTQVTGSIAKSQLFYVANPVVGAGHTATIAGSSCFGCIDMVSFSGGIGASPFDVEAHATASGTSLQAGSITPAVDGELIFTMLGFEAANSSVAIDSGFAFIDGTGFAAGSHFGEFTAYSIKGTGTAGAAVNPTWSWTSSVRAMALSASFKPRLTRSHPYTGTELSTIQTWANTYHAPVADTVNTRLLVIDGNSLVAGYPSQTSFAAWLLGTQAGFTTNFDSTGNELGIPTRTGATQILAFPTNVAPLLLGTYAKKMYLVWELTNDIAAGLTAAQAVANIQTLCQMAKAVDPAVKTIAMTCLPRVTFGTSGPLETIRLAANTLLKALPSGIDAVMDGASIANLSDYTNATYYVGDEIHLTSAGQQQLVTDPTYGLPIVLTPYI